MTDHSDAFFFCRARHQYWCRKVQDCALGHRTGVMYRKVREGVSGSNEPTEFLMQKQDDGRKMVRHSGPQTSFVARGEFTLRKVTHKLP